MHKKRRFSIILEVAVLFLISVLTIGFLTQASERRRSDSNVVKQTEQRASQIGEEVRMAVEEYPAYKWLLRYWYTHADELEIEYDAGFERGTETEQKCRLLHKLKILPKQVRKQLSIRQNFFQKIQQRLCIPNMVKFLRN